MTDDKNYFFQFLRSSIMWLEKYTEVAKYYPDWKQKKQTDASPILWVKEDTPTSKILHNVGTILMVGFEGELDEQPLELREEIKQEFYKWLNTSGINNDNAPLELKCALFDFHEILECNFEKARKDRADRKREIEIDDPRYIDKLQELYSKTQQSIHSGKNEMDGAPFNGDAEEGKKTFETIANSLTAEEKDNFHFWPQKDSPEKKENDENDSENNPDDKKPKNTEDDLTAEQITKLEKLIKELKNKSELSEAEKKDLKDKEKELNKLKNQEENKTPQIPLPLYISLAIGVTILIVLVILFLTRSNRKEK